MGRKLCKACATASTRLETEQRKIYLGALRSSDLLTWPKTHQPLLIHFFLQRPLPEAQMRQAGESAQQDQSRLRAECRARSRASSEQVRDPRARLKTKPNHVRSGRVCLLACHQNAQRPSLRQRQQPRRLLFLLFYSFIHVIQRSPGLKMPAMSIT